MFVMMATELPMGPAPEPVSAPHFPDRLHAYVWRNWEVAPTERLAEVVGAAPEDIVRMGKAMGLSGPPHVTEDAWARSTTTIIRRNWHLLPYDQLLRLLGWTPDEMVYHLREDDFLYIKLGMLKPKCAPIVYALPDAKALEREKEIARVVREAFPQGVGISQDPPLGFIKRLEGTPEEQPMANLKFNLTPRFCFSYFGLTGDPFLGKSEDIYPDGYLARLAARGVDGVWLQGVLYTLAPFPWDPKFSNRYEERLENLRGLVARAKKFGIGVYLYLNEPRAMPVRFFEQHPDMKGVDEGDYAALCTSNGDVQKWIRDSVASVSKAVPELRGFFSISASENLTNCYSHLSGKGCPRCGKRTPQEVIAEVNTLFVQGIQEAGTKAELIVWDWGWDDKWAEGIINALPKEAALMSVSEWSIPIERGGIRTETGEYSMSTIGPGPRALRHWDLAKKRGMRTVAKIQAGTTWEIGSVPYIPVVLNVAEHIDRLRKADLNGLMLSWTLGGYPSPNLEVVAEMSRVQQGRPSLTPDEAMQTVAARWFGPALAPRVVEMWRELSVSFREFPVAGGLLYVAPQHVGPANPLWEAPTNYKATMVGYPYDDLEGWRAIYPEEIFIGQFTKMADGFDAAIAKLRETAKGLNAEAKYRKALEEESDVADACAIHWRTVANQARFVSTRRALAAASDADKARTLIAELEQVLKDEIVLAQRLFAIQSRDSRIGFEASNQYYYVPMDLAEKVLNCRDLLDRWLPGQRGRFGLP
jgi:hypothetical protein